MDAYLLHWWRKCSGYRIARTWRKLTTNLIKQDADTLRARSAEVARHDALDANRLGGTYEVALIVDRPSDDGADEDVHTLEGLLEALDAI